MTYNVHLLTHLPNDCIKNGPLDSFSAFKFENYLGKIKNLVSSPFKPIEQIHNRLRELFHSNILINPKAEHFILKDSINFNSYSKLIINDIVLIGNSKKDSFVKSVNNKLYKVTKFVKENSSIIIVANEFGEVSNAYELPVESSRLGIFKINLNDYSSEVQLDVKDIKCKMVPMPWNNDENILSI